MVRNTILYSQLALSGSASLGRARPPRRRLVVETGASCGSPLSSWPLIHGAPRQIDWPLPDAKEAGAEAYTSSASESRPCVANGR